MIILNNVRNRFSCTDMLWELILSIQYFFSFLFSELNISDFSNCLTANWITCVKHDKCEVAENVCKVSFNVVIMTLLLLTLFMIIVITRSWISSSCNIRSVILLRLLSVCLSSICSKFNKTLLLWVCIERIIWVYSN